MGRFFSLACLLGLCFLFPLVVSFIFACFPDLDEDQRKFGGDCKNRIDRFRIKKVANRQIAILFFLPIVVALIHGSVALTALSNLFDYNLTVESSLVLGSFALIQIVYFFIVRFFYVKQVRRAIV